jgi:hypothetical protein
MELDFMMGCIGIDELSIPKVLMQILPLFLSITCVDMHMSDLMILVIVCHIHDHDTANNKVQRRAECISAVRFPDLEACCAGYRPMTHPR